MNPRLPSLWFVGLVCGCPQAEDAPHNDSDPTALNEPPPAPIAVLAPISPKPLLRDLLCAVDVVPVDPEGDDVELTFRWLRNGQPWTGLTTTNTHPGDGILAHDLAAGTTWTCEVQAIDIHHASSAPTVVATTVSRPNVLLLIADDLGYGDVGFQGGTVIATPQIDALAAESVRFSAGYVAAPVCGPSRAALLTGRQPSRIGFEFNTGAPALAAQSGAGLPLGEESLADVLGTVGLETMLVGKWHLGVMIEQNPLTRGFDHYFGFLAGERLSLMPDQLGQLDVWSPLLPVPMPWPEGHWGEALTDDGRYVLPDPSWHLTERLAAEGLKFLDHHRNSPFFLQVSFHAPHEPLQAGTRELARLPVVPEDDGLAAYQATVAGLDFAVGSLLAGLEAIGADEDTIVIFVSDNGCTEFFGWCSNGPYADGKARLTEGGLRVPFVVRWPGRLESRDIDVPVSTLDLFPTLVAAVGVPVASTPTLDGVDLLPLLLDDTVERPHEDLYWRMGPARAVRSLDDKLVEVGEHTWLFDLATDPGETQDLAADHPDRVAELRALLDARESEYVEPLWEGTPTEADYYGTTLPFVF